MAPLIEEIIFRKAIREAIKNKKLYVIVSSLIFGAFHILGAAESLFSWLYVIPYAALGVSFAYTYIKTDNIYSSMCLHSFHNFITIIQLLLLYIGG
jgi:membrane protease YdiL (CAAX protease family)